MEETMRFYTAVYYHDSDVWQATVEARGIVMALSRAIDKIKNRHQSGDFEIIGVNAIPPEKNPIL